MDPVAVLLLFNVAVWCYWTFKQMDPVIIIAAAIILAVEIYIRLL